MRVARWLLLVASVPSEKQESQPSAEPGEVFQERGCSQASDAARACLPAAPGVRVRAVTGGGVQHGLWAAPGARGRRARQT